MKNTKKALGLALALTMMAGAAQASFTVENDPKARISRVSVPSKGGLVQVGSPTKAQPVVRGFAKEVSLITALKQIVPNGWHAKRSGGLDVSQLVSWRGDGRNWVDVLQTLATDNGVLATLDWERRELIVAPATMKTAAPLAEISNKPRIAVLSPIGSAKRSDSVSAAPVMPPKPMAPVAKVWTLRADLTLRENIEAWAKKGGYHVSWAAVNYPIAQPVTLTGELDAEGGPLHQLVEAYRTAEQPISVSFWSNNVIRVENTSYKHLQLKDEAPNRRAMN